MKFASQPRTPSTNTTRGVKEARRRAAASENVTLTIYACVCLKKKSELLARYRTISSRGICRSGAETTKYDLQYHDANTHYQFITWSPVNTHNIHAIIYTTHDYLEGHTQCMLIRWGLYVANNQLVDCPLV